MNEKKYPLDPDRVFFSGETVRGVVTGPGEWNFERLKMPYTGSGEYLRTERLIERGFPVSLWGIEFNLNEDVIDIKGSIYDRTTKRNIIEYSSSLEEKLWQRLNLILCKVRRYKRPKIVINGGEKETDVPSLRTLEMLTEKNVGYTATIIPIGGHKAIYQVLEKEEIIGTGYVLNDGKGLKEVRRIPQK